WSVWPAVQGIAVACLVTLLFTLPPLLAIRDIRPALIFRRDVEGGARWPGTAFARRVGHAARLPLVPAPRGRAPSRRGAARCGESLPAGESGAGGGGRARRRRHVHAHRVPGAERAGRPDSRLRAAGHAQRVP